MKVFVLDVDVLSEEELEDENIAQAFDDEFLDEIEPSYQCIVPKTLGFKAIEFEEV